MTIKEKFVNLSTAWRDDTDMLEFLEDASNHFIDYVRAVTQMETRIPIIKFRLEGQDIVDAIESLDRARRNCHEAAIAAVTSLGRAARADGLEPIFDGDAADRLAVADFCMEFVAAFFKDRAIGTQGKLNLMDLITDKGDEA